MTSQNPPKTLREIFFSRRFMIIFASMVIVFSPLVYLSTATGIQVSSNDQSTLALTILGSNMTLGDYFPLDNRTIGEGERVSWYVVVNNGLEKAEYLSLRVKLLNSTHAIPNDLTNQPSSEPVIYEIQHLVAKNSTWIIPTNWTVTEISPSGEGDGNNSTRIHGMVLNDRDISNIRAEDSNGKGFKLIFELWRYDSDAKSFVFALPSESTATDQIENTKRSIWTQIWFDLRA